MQEIFRKTFGGLSPRYYFRQLFFGGLMLGLGLFMVLNGKGPMRLDVIAMLILNTLLYPYARFVYESIVGFVIGDNVFWASPLLLLPIKLFTMLICWMSALFVAPVGLIYLYYHHSKVAG